MKEVVGLLEKFDQVEIKPYDRISEDDRVFCTAQQEAYEKAREVFKRVIQLVGDGQVEQMKLLKRSEREVYTTYLGSTHDFSAEKFLSELDATHRRFVGRIVQYFKGKYHVSLDEEAIFDVLIQKRPQESSELRMFNHMSKWTEEDTKRFIELSAAYTKSVQDAETHNRNMVIRYETILDYIFAQLGGGSFRDVADKELKDACHKASWNEHNGQPKFEQKKAVIRYTGYGCGIDHIHEKYKDRDDDSEFHLSDDMKQILAAVNHFELGTQSHTMTGISSLCGYRVTGQQHEIGGEKIVSVKLYKSNHVDLRFSSEAYAREFVEQYMGTVA